MWNKLEMGECATESELCESSCSSTCGRWQHFGEAVKIGNSRGNRGMRHAGKREAKVIMFLF